MIKKYLIFFLLFSGFLFSQDFPNNLISSGKKELLTKDNIDFSEVSSISEDVFKNIVKNYFEDVNKKKVEEEGIKNAEKKFNLNIQNLSFKGDKKSLDKNINIILQNLKENGKLDGLKTFKNLLDALLNGMLTSLGDPYSFYLNKDISYNLTDVVEGTFGGVGIVIKKKNVYDEDGNIKMGKGYIKVMSLVKNSPAQKAGVLKGDKIISVEGKPTSSMLVDTFLKLSRGKIGTNVKFEIKRGNARIKFSVKRDRIEIQTVSYSKLPKDIGYIRISEFSKKTSVEFMKALIELEDYENSNDGVQKLIIDLRGNPGGLLTAALSMSDLFLDDGIILGVKSRHDDQTAKANKNLFFSKKIPIIILVDSSTASASEIFAGALKDTKNAYLLGQKTFGKGKIQQVIYIKSGKYGVYRLTTQKYYTPSGTFIDKIGINPNYKIDLPKLKFLKNKSIYIMYHYIDEYKKNHPTNPKVNSQDYKKLIKIVEEKSGIPRYYTDLHLKNMYDDKYNIDFDLELKQAIFLIKNTNILKKIQKNEIEDISLNKIYSKNF